MSKGYIPLQVKFAHYFVCLEGPNITVWLNNDADASYMGAIEGIQERFSDLFKYLLDNRYIMPGN